MGYIGAGLTRFNTADELTVTGDAEFDGNLTVKGTHITLDSATVQTVDLGDNDKIRLGDSDDLQIYHDSSNSYISDVGTGDLLITSNGAAIRIHADQINLSNAAGSKDSLIALNGGATTIYYDGATKLATTATGIGVTGHIDVNTSGNRAKLGYDSNNVYIGSTSGTGEIHFKNNIGSTDAPHSSGDTKMVITDSGVGIGQSNPTSPNGATDFLHIGNSSNQDTSIVLQDAVEIWEIYNNDDLLFNFDTTNVMTLQRVTGNVGIGITSPSAVLDVKSSGTTSTAFRVLKSDANTNLHAMTEISGHGRLSVYNNVEGEGIRLDSNGTSIFNGGGVSIGTSSPISGVMLDIRPTSTTRIINTRSFNTSLQFHHAFENNSGTLVGSIAVSTTSTTYNTSSDYRLKENVTANWDATTRLKQLNPVRFNFIADADTTVDGFLAHEVQDIVPEAITGTKDAMMDEEYQVSAATGDIYTPAVAATYDEDGVELTAAVDEVIHSADVEQPEELAESQQWRETTAAVMGTRSVPDYQGIDQSKLVPLLCKTILELEARIAALETA